MEDVEQPLEEEQNLEQILEKPIEMKEVELDQPMVDIQTNEIVPPIEEVAFPIQIAVDENLNEEPEQEEDYLSEKMISQKIEEELSSSHSADIEANQPFLSEPFNAEQMEEDASIMRQKEREIEERRVKENEMFQFTATQTVTQTYKAPEE